MLYAKLEEMLKRQNVTNLYAGAADPTEENDKYLTRDSEYTCPPEEFIPFSKIRSTL